jgi:hypothetical protein
VRARLGLLFPFACLLLITGAMVVGRAIAPGSDAALPPCHDAAAGSHGSGLAGLPAPLYYASIAIVLILSFALFEWQGAREAAGERAAPPRLDLLDLRWLRALIVHPATRVVLQVILVGWFALIIAAGLFGNQLPTKNIAPVLTWTVWWGGLILLILYVGKAWCYVCPWDAVAGWVEGLRFVSKRRAALSLGLRWPRALRNIWFATILFVGLTWVELGFGVTMRPRVTAWLGLAMLGLAFVSALIFDRKAFCRYGCLVGRVSGLYALFAPVEVRAKDRGVCRTCRTRSCYRGNDRGEACPTFQYLGAMDQNTYCIACMECVKTCEVDNVALRLRPWGADLLAHARARSDEAYLALLMLSLAGFHGLTMTTAWGRLIDWLTAGLGVGERVAFAIGMAGIMVGPIVVYALLVALSRFAAGASMRGYRDHFVRYAYVLLPIALFYHLAHNSEHLLMEGQRVVALLSDPFGWEWNLFGTARWTLRPLTSLQTIWGIQIVLVLIGHVYSLWAARRAAMALFQDRRVALLSQLPMLAGVILFSLISLWLLRQPMQMRTSWM